MKLELNLKELLSMYQNILKDIRTMEEPIIPYEERILQYNPEREQERRKKHIESLKGNKEYLRLVTFRDELEKVTIPLAINEE